MRDQHIAEAEQVGAGMGGKRAPGRGEESGAGGLAGGNAYAMTDGR